MAADRRRSVGFGLFRQRARTAGHGRLFTAASHDDADSGSLGRKPANGRRASCILRIQRRDDGAVGRPCRRGLHRRSPDRRYAGPKWSASGALSDHRRRHRHARLRDGRADLPAGRSKQEVASATGQDVPDRSGTGPHHRRRGTEAQYFECASVPSMDRAESSAPGESAGRRRQRRST